MKALERDERISTKAVQLQAQNPPDSQTIIVQRRPTTPPPLSPLYRLPIRTPERPRPRRSPSPEATPESLLPSSTAPPMLGEDTGRDKRKRMLSSKAKRAGAGER
jgi:hypothetical protein